MGTGTETVPAVDTNLNIKTEGKTISELKDNKHNMSL